MTAPYTEQVLYTVTRNGKYLDFASQKFLYEDKADCEKLIAEMQLKDKQNKEENEYRMVKLTGMGEVLL